DTSGNTVYGLTGDNTFSQGGIDICHLKAGTYVDAAGTFELSDECPYTL
ncbi:hypothetical protein HDR63_04340, partial [bacterium]|nr:hypothetical protein [bacterium]